MCRSAPTHLKVVPIPSLWQPELIQTWHPFERTVRLLWQLYYNEWEDGAGTNKDTESADRLCTGAGTGMGNLGSDTAVGAGSALGSGAAISLGMSASGVGIADLRWGIHDSPSTGGGPASLVGGVPLWDMSQPGTFIQGTRVFCEFSSKGCGYLYFNNLVGGGGGFWCGDGIQGGTAVAAGTISGGKDDQIGLGVRMLTLGAALFVILKLQVVDWQDRRDMRHRLRNY
ncbi:hypothetical protein B0H19DRAFT_1058649 [Mycena capillaripes]|nr:hypothetical protein B0H19DRAFT_1058649 [Mycena capillaripes]